MTNEMLYLVAQMLKVDLTNEISIIGSCLQIKLNNKYVNMFIKKI